MINIQGSTFEIEIESLHVRCLRFEIDGEEVRGDAEEGDITLHGGFKNAYDSVRSRLRTIVRALSEEPGIPAPSDLPQSQRSGDSRLSSETLDTSKAGASTGAGAGSGGVKEIRKTAGKGTRGGDVQGENDTWSLLVTGHSLGGALATLFAAEMAVAAEAEGSRIGHVAMYNFGEAPGCGGSLSFLTCNFSFGLYSSA